MIKNRETFNKIILVAIIGVLTVGNLILIYLRFSSWIEKKKILFLNN